MSDTEVQAQPEPVKRDIAAEVESAERAMLAQRDVVTAVKDRVSKARHAFALALRNWMKEAGAPPDQNELMRRHAKAQYEHRAAVARGEIDPNAGRPADSVGPSILDRTAAATAGHRGPGGGRSFARGAYPSQHQGGYAAPRKLPS